jgi:hypothetical protein
MLEHKTVYKAVSRWEINLPKNLKSDPTLAGMYIGIRSVFAWDTMHKCLLLGFSL